MKRVAKQILLRPKGLEMGEGSVIWFPRVIDGAERIKMGAGSRIWRHAKLNAMKSHAGVELNGRIELGDDVYVGGYAQIFAMGLIKIGDGSVLSEHVYISDAAHGFCPRSGPILEQPLESKGPVILGKRVFVGFGASVLPGVELGDGCIVGTRSVVTRSFPAGSVIGGAPARLLKRNPELISPVAVRRVA